MLTCSLLSFLKESGHVVPGSRIHIKEAIGIYDRLEVEIMTSTAYTLLQFQFSLTLLYVTCGPHILSQAEALWESKS